MNTGKKSEDLGRSGLTRSKLFGAFGHVHNSSLVSHRDDDFEDYRQDERIVSVRAMNLQVEMAKAEAFFMAYNLVARFQKS